ncbi:MAG: hypothetical protein KBA26_05360 [Candidatus Delongbacteria bacterium]|nr:hypothetical protein [Candidatus Delongbacteria bacterium]
MVWRKSWWILIILSCSQLRAEIQAVGDLDSLQIERLIDFFDTLSYRPDTGYIPLKLDSVKLSDCRDTAYRMDERLKLYSFRSAKITYIMRINESVRDTLWSYIDCYGGKQMMLTRNRSGRNWKKITDLKHPYRYIFADHDTLGYVEDNSLAGLIDSLKDLSPQKKDKFFSRIQAAAAILSQDWGIRMAGIGRVCGQSCLKLYIEQIRKYVWYWKHLILKTETRLPSGDREIVEAIRLEVDIPLADSLFIVPKRNWLYKQFPNK